MISIFFISFHFDRVIPKGFFLYSKTCYGTFPIVPAKKINESFVETQHTVGHRYNLSVHSLKMNSRLLR